MLVHTPCNKCIHAYTPCHPTAMRTQQGEHSKEQRGFVAFIVFKRPSHPFLDKRTIFWLKGDERNKETPARGRGPCARGQSGSLLAARQRVSDGHPPSASVLPGLWVQIIKRNQIMEKNNVFRKHTIEKSNVGW